MGWVCPYKNLMRIVNEVRQEQQERLDWLRDPHSDGNCFIGRDAGPVRRPGGDQAV